MSSQIKNWLVTLGFTLCGGPGLLGVIFPLWITRWRLPRPFTPWQWVGVVLILLGLPLLLESIVRFVRVGRGTLMPTAPTEELVVSGLYRHVRNPMYVGVMTCVAGQALLFRSGDLAVYDVVLWLGFSAFVMFYEEPTLARKYGTSYEIFCENVPRWLPRVRAWRG